jgi:hypothetical protein
MRLNLTRAYIASLVWSGFLAAALFAAQLLRLPILLVIVVAFAVWIAGMVRIWVVLTRKE